jgi:hypothetical protein
MRGNGRAGPHRAHLTHNVIAHGDHVVHNRRAKLSELMPALAAQLFGRKVNGLKHL